MPRPREFDEQQVLQRAMELFWRRGYTATSVRDLVTELDLNPSSLYGAFGDKHALYLRALERYAQTESVAAAQQLSEAGPTRAVLRAWLLASVDALQADPDGKGCMMVNAATELGACDAEVGTAVRNAFRGIRHAVRELLVRGQRTGELAADLDVDAVSALLTTTMVGLRVQGRSGADHAELVDAVDGALAALR